MEKFARFLKSLREKEYPGKGTDSNNSGTNEDRKFVSQTVSSLRTINFFKNSAAHTKSRYVLVNIGRQWPEYNNKDSE